ncbi:MAG: COX15/CtaA family protein [Zoogloeaceae bacterium]|nr:COX15/CtaA family protein [Zoogloeaceae bacterium]
MSATDARLRQIRWLALLVCALSLLVVGISAYLRLDAAGIGCAPWPGCYGQVLSGEPAALHYGFARLLHRAAASSALLLTIFLVWRCMRPQPLLPAARYAGLLLLLMLALSGLGFLSADPRRALVGFLNIVGGLGLVTFSWRLAMAAGALGKAPESAARGWVLHAGIVALTLAVMMGAWIGATYSAIACSSLPWCDMNHWGAADSLRLLNPLVRPDTASLPGDAAGSLLHLLHRSFAVLALVLLFIAGWRAHRVAARVVACLLVLVMVLGGWGVQSTASLSALWLIVAHGAMAALLLAAVATWLRR